VLGGVGDGGGPSTVIARMHRWSLLSTRFLRRSGPRLRGAKGQYARVHLAVMIFLCVTSRWCYAQMRSSDFLLLPLGSCSPYAKPPSPRTPEPDDPICASTRQDRQFRMASHSTNAFIRPLPMSQ